MEEELKAWRMACERGHRQGKQKRYTEAQRAAGLELLDRAVASGIGIERAASMLGVTTASVRRWRARPAGFSVVRVEEEPAPVTAAVLVTVRGLRAELTVAQLAELVERLS